MSARSEHELQMVRTRVGKLRDFAHKPYDWMQLWNSACEQLAAETKDKAFRKHVVFGLRGHAPIKIGAKR